jgi:hypothetical protein
MTRNCHRSRQGERADIIPGAERVFDVTLCDGVGMVDDMGIFKTTVELAPLHDHAQ